MSKYRHQLPLKSGLPFVTDAGLETELVFKENYDLPEFASFPLLKSEKGREDIQDYYAHYIDIARQHETGLVLEAPTWRASAEWGNKLNYNADELAWFNQQAIEMLSKLRDEAELAQPIVISGCIGPRYDGYDPEYYMSVAEAETYHTAQIETFSQTQVDVATALTMTSINEALGVTRAAMKFDMPVIISFTTETDGKLPSGESLQQAIETVDRESYAYPFYYMVNCAHPTHFQHEINGDDMWTRRIGGIRANASCKSHTELDECTELDSGNPQDLGQQYRALKSRLSNLHVLGGCCGTNHQHVHEMARACF
ncbi:MAG: homocysteine S-methyltransferase family protein [Gammaproteobacteria bacterium]|nr:homocysteine S-methyltransferase family protein [Gammaproteobacteria bacterium]